MTDVRKCDNHHGDVNGIRKVCQLMRYDGMRFDGHMGDVKILGEVSQLSEGVTVISVRC